MVANHAPVSTSATQLGATVDLRTGDWRHWRLDFRGVSVRCNGAQFGCFGRPTEHDLGLSQAEPLQVAKHCQTQKYMCCSMKHRMPRSASGELSFCLWPSCDAACPCTAQRQDLKERLWPLADAAAGNQKPAEWGQESRVDWLTTRYVHTRPQREPRVVSL